MPLTSDQKRERRRLDDKRYRKAPLLMGKVFKRAEIEAKAADFIRSASTPPGAKGVKAVSAKQLDKLVTRVTQESIQAIELGGGRVEG